MNSYIEKRNKLPEPLKDFLISDTPRHEIERACFMYGITEEDMRQFAIPIAPVFLRELELKDYPMTVSQNIQQSEKVIYGVAFEINKRIFNRFPDFFRGTTELLEQWMRIKAMPLISEEEAWQKVMELEPEIQEEENQEKEVIATAKVEEQKYQARLVTLVPEQAYAQFPEIGEQLITSELIRIKSALEPVRPSIKNWLADYTFKLGFNQHSSIERGTYLFQDENAKNLSFQDKQQLSYILKAYDEKNALTIDTSAKKVVFPVIHSERTNSVTQSAPAKKEDVSFSYGQKLPYEKMQTIEQEVSPISFPKKEIPVSPINKNVVNLKELS